MSRSAQFCTQATLKVSLIGVPFRFGGDYSGPARALRRQSMAARIGV
jgi:hypothetical protein